MKMKHQDVIAKIFIVACTFSEEYINSNDINIISFSLFIDVNLNVWPVR